ncbi:TPA: LPXTG cell wall anchor domain-containing protein [Streptococcus suis]
MDKKQLTLASATATMMLSSFGAVNAYAEEITTPVVDTSSIPVVVATETPVASNVGDTVSTSVETPSVDTVIEEVEASGTTVIDAGSVPVIPDNTTPTVSTEVVEHPTETPNPVAPSVEVPVDASSVTTELEEPVVPTDPSLPTVPSSEGENTSSSTESSETPLVPSETVASNVSPTSPATPIYVPNVEPEPAPEPEYTPEVGEVSEDTGQVVTEVSYEKPIVTNTGFTVVSTDQGRPIIQNLDGSTSIVSVESIGGSLNTDGTISIKNSSGSMTTLPRTGGDDTFLLVTIGLFILALLGFSTIREDQDNWEVVV